MPLAIQVNTDRLTPFAGWWGFVEFADASLKAQAEHTYSIVVDGQVLLLVAPIEPVPAHASALAAAAPSVIPTAATYRYNHVQAVAAQTQYAPYTYPGYEYDATYGKGTMLHAALVCNYSDQG